ncbi:MAG: C40 family peptidase, partial [Tetrasphaera sp.]|nr:C40 family peptidase [Tetrasphaera sp.]
TSTSTSTRPTTTSSSTPPPTSTSTSTPPPASGAAAAIAYAQAQLGKPYLWGGSGPDAFDCSGLTMMAWRQAGVYLSHYTGAQYAETARVPIDQLQPGDLVFFGSSGESSHHMGLYVGGGQMIEAPYTGAVIRYASIYRSDLVPYGGRPG